MNISEFIRWAASILCGIAGFLWGNLDGLLIALIVFMILDYMTGIIAGLIEKKLSSTTGFRGLLKKGLILLIVAVGHILDAHIFGGETSMCRSAVIGFYLSNEGLSILENAGRIGIPLPKFLIKTLEQLRKEDSHV